MDTLSEIFERTKDFYDRHIDCYGNRWEDNESLPDIISGRHGQWISFKNVVVRHRREICDNLLICQNIKMAIRLVETVLELYQTMIDFIQIHRTEIPEEEVPRTSKEGIAIELRGELQETIGFIQKTCPDIHIPKNVSESTNKENVIDSIFFSEKARCFFDYLKDIGYVEQESDGRFRWLETASLYGYFVDQCSEYLSIKPSNERIPWKRFESLISNHYGLLKGARQGVYLYNSKDMSKPEGYLIIYDYCHNQI